MSSETNVTELGSKPAGASPGVGEGDGEGDGRRLGAGLTEAEGAERGLRDGVPTEEEHAESSRHTDAAPPARKRFARTVLVINARNASPGCGVTN
jgi:hypothetical protein